MALVTHASGTYTDTPSDTWDIVSNGGAVDTTDGILQVEMFLSGSLVLGEYFEARFGVKDSGGTLRYRKLGSWNGVPSNRHIVRVIGAVLNDWTLELRQRTGTGRATDWYIHKAT